MYWVEADQGCGVRVPLPLSEGDSHWSGRRYSRSKYPLGTPGSCGPSLNGGKHCYRISSTRWIEWKEEIGANNSCLKARLISGSTSRADVLRSRKHHGMAEETSFK